MSSPSPLQAFHNVGKLSALAEGQTYDFATAYPHGGTALGLVRDVQIRRTEGRQIITAEEFGVEVVDEVYTGEAWVIAFALRGWDSDAILEVFPNTNLGSSSKFRGVDYPGTTIKPGALKSATATKVLFTPDDDKNHPAVYMPNAIAELAEDLTIALGRTEEVLIACAFRALRDGATAGRSVQVRLLEDLSA